MNATQLQSVAMTPKRKIELEVWECRHCRAVRPVGGKEPERCWNYKCRRADWDRPKIKIGRPRKDAKKSKKKKSTKEKTR